MTVRRDDCPAFLHLRGRYAEGLSEEGIFVLYRVIDGLVDSFFPLLEELDDRIDELEDAIFAGPTDAQLQEIFGLKRRLMRMRKVVAPERDLLAGLSGARSEAGRGSRRKPSATSSTSTTTCSGSAT